MDSGRLPLGLKIGWTVFVLLWVPIYGHWYGAANFLWFCDLANFFLRAILAVRDPVGFPPRSEPVPDFMLLRPRPDPYSQGHPGAGDVLLLVEVADSRPDREWKIPLRNTATHSSRARRCGSLPDEKPGATETIRPLWSPRS